MNFLHPHFSISPCSLESFLLYYLYLKDEMLAYPTPKKLIIVTLLCSSKNISFWIPALSYFFIKSIDYSFIPKIILTTMCACSTTRLLRSFRMISTHFTVTQHRLAMSMGSQKLHADRYLLIFYSYVYIQKPTTW